MACDAAAMVRIGSVVMNVTDIRRAAEFWGRALGYVARPGNPAFLVPESGEGPRLHLDEDDRMHLDLWVANEEDQLAEVERLVSLGARRVDWVYPEGADFVVLADTEGNLFCVVNTGQ
jgi:catechol 2,3-dioxygenase-like lactoylglutathione lyase family enzyme